MGALTRSFDFHGVRIDVVSEDPSISEQLARRLRRFATDSRASPDLVFHYEVRSDTGAGSHGDSARPQGARPVYDPPVGEVVYGDADDRMYIGYRDRLELRSDGGSGRVRTALRPGFSDDIWLASHPFFTLAFLEQLKRRKLFGIHAALLCRGGCALILPGTSGAGKSTLTLCLLRAGFAFGGDDLCFLRRDGGHLRVLAFPDELDVAENTVSFFPELSGLREQPPRPDARKWPLLPEEVYSIEFATVCEPALLVFPRVGNRTASMLEPMDAAEALVELVPNIILTEPSSSQEHLDAIGELVRRSRCFRLETGRDFDRLPGLLDEALLDGTPGG